MGALGDFFQGAYAYSEQERLRQVEEDNKFKLYEKQQRLVNSLADEDRKTQVVEWEPRPDEGIVVGLNANGDVVTTRPMDKMTQQTAAAGLTKTNNEAATTGLELSLLGQFGARERQAEIDYRGALTDTTRKQGNYYDKMGAAAGSKDGPGAGALSDADASEVSKKIDASVAALTEEFGDELLPDDIESLEQTLTLAPDRVSGIALVNDVRREIAAEIKARREAAARKAPVEGRSGRR